MTHTLWKHWESPDAGGWTPLKDGDREELEAIAARLKRHTSQDKRVSIPLSSVTDINPVGYCRQRRESHGMVDFYTRDKAVKSDR